MASRREYEMAFRLNAKLNSGFSSAISKARDDFVRLGKELQNLTKDQENIQSYQKQQKAIEATTSKIKELEKELENVRRSKDIAGQSDDQLNKQEAELVTRLNAANATLKSQAQALGNTGEKLRASGIDTRNLTSESARLSAEINRLDGEQQKAAKSVESFGKSGKDAFDAVSAAASGIVASKVFETLVDGFEECVQVAAQFQETMSTVQALSGATSEDMGSLSDKAKELGATTKFTANEAGQAMTYMAMAGWDTQQMLSGMDGVMNLAAASGEDLAQVSDIVTDNLTAFGMKAEDTAHFADVLAATATSSNTSVGIMGETFKNAAAVAGALGYSIEDVSVGVGLMANAGIKGSMAGTALKNTFNGLLEGVTMTSDAFGEYEFSATKADGTMKSFSATTQELRKYFNQMSESEKVANAQAIAGERAYNGLLAILNATDADYANLANSIDECSGAAAAQGQQAGQVPPRRQGGVLFPR